MCCVYVCIVCVLWVYVLYVYMSVGVVGVCCVCLCVCTLRISHVEDRSQLWVFSSNSLNRFFFEMRSLAEPGPQDLSVSPCWNWGHRHMPPHLTSAITWLLRVWTWVLKFAHQMLSHWTISPDLEGETTVLSWEALIPPPQPHTQVHTVSLDFSQHALSWVCSPSSWESRGPNHSTETPASSADCIHLSRLLLSSITMLSSPPLERIMEREPCLARSMIYEQTIP